MIKFDDEEIPRKDVVDKHLALYIKVNILGNLVKRALVDIGSGLNIFSISFLQHFQDRLPHIARSTMKIKGFDNVEKKCVGIVIFSI